jgi:dCTP deaminase
MMETRQPGVFGRADLGLALRRGWVKSSAPGSPPPAPGPSALDLVLADRYWEMPGSLRPLPDPGAKVEAILSLMGKRRSARGPITIRVGKVCVFQLALALDLPTPVTGRATGKSSVGRLDVLTRLLCNGGRTFDEVPAGYSGPLFVEVVPNSFDIVVAPFNANSALNQLRLFWGEPSESRLSLRDALALSPEGRVLYDHAPLHREDLDSHLASLRVNLHPKGRAFTAFAPKATRRGPIDLTAEKSGRYSGKKYWEPVMAAAADGREYISLAPDRFYILASRERFTLPQNLCVECRAYQETLGEYRIHYAGFVHPEFGKGRDRGTPLILEVRPHSAPALLFGHEPVANVEFYRMAEPTEGESSYSEQELTLSKYFKDDF